MPEKSYQEVWNNCLSIIRDNVTAQNFKTWFKPIKAVKLDDKILTVQVPSQFFYEWLENNYITLIKKTLKRELGKDAKLEYNILLETSSGKKPYVTKLPSSDQAGVKNNPVSMPINMGDSTIRNPFIIPGLQKININPQLNESYTFDAYIEGECNRLARSAGFAVSQNPGGTSFNPLLIYSATGLGKTHLLQAIGNKIIMQNGNMRVVYLTSEKFMLDFISSIQKNHSTNFINHYRNIDRLLLDDAQFFQSKEQTQEQFFHLFNDLFQKGKQIVLTTDRHPNELRGLNERLVSRFQSGLIVDIQPPDLETRIAILMKKGEDDGLEIPYEVTEEPVSITFLGTNDWKARKFWYDWHEHIQANGSWNMRYYKDFIGTVSISVYNEDSQTAGTPTHKVVLHECWPKTIGAIELGWESGELVDFTVDVGYSWWTQE